MSKSQPSQHNEFLLTTLPESYLSEQVYCRTCKLPLTRQEYYDRHSRHNIDDSYNPKNYPDPKKNEVKPPSFLSPNSITNGRVIPKQFSLIIGLLCLKSPLYIKRIITSLLSIFLSIISAILY